MASQILVVFGLDNGLLAIPRHAFTMNSIGATGLTLRHLQREMGTNINEYLKVLVTKWIFCSVGQHFPGLNELSRKLQSIKAMSSAGARLDTNS